MKKLTLQFALIAFLSTGILISSCNKKDETTPADDTSITQDDALAENLFDEATSIADEAYNLGSQGLKSTNDGVFLGPCAEITLDTAANPNALIIDFGEENCLCNDGKYRRGKIVVSFTGPYWWPGTVITTGFDEFHVNDHKLEGTKVVTNMGKNDDGHPYFIISVNGVVHRAQGGTFSWNAELQREMVEGFATWKIRDDVHHITGEANGIRPNGSTWEREIINDLRVEMNCKFIVSGTVELRPEGQSVMLLDFGDGECDNIATVLIDGVTYTIYLD